MSRVLINGDACDTGVVPMDEGVWGMTLFKLALPSIVHNSLPVGTSWFAPCTRGILDVNIKGEWVSSFF